MICNQVSCDRRDKKGWILVARKLAACLRSVFYHKHPEIRLIMSHVDKIKAFRDKKWDVLRYANFDFDMLILVYRDFRFRQIRGKFLCVLKHPQNRFIITMRLFVIKDGYSSYLRFLSTRSIEKAQRILIGVWLWTIERGKILLSFTMDFLSYDLQIKSENAGASITALSLWIFHPVFCIIRS